MTLLFVALGIAVVAGVAVLIVRDRPLVEDDPVGARPLRWSSDPRVQPSDIDAVRFSVAMRGYRMDEVDRVLDDTRRALSERDSQIADLQRAVARLAGPGDASGTPGS